MLLMRPAATVFPEVGRLVDGVRGAHENGIVVGSRRPDAGVGNRERQLESVAAGDQRFDQSAAAEFDIAAVNGLDCPSALRHDRPGDIEFLFGEETLVPREKNGRVVGQRLNCEADVCRRRHRLRRGFHRYADRRNKREDA